MSARPRVSIVDHFADLSDPRRREGTYPLMTFLLIGICAIGISLVPRTGFLLGGASRGGDASANGFRGVRSCSTVYLRMVLALEPGSAEEAQRRTFPRGEWACGGSGRW